MLLVNEPRRADALSYGPVPRAFGSANLSTLRLNRLDLWSRVASLALTTVLIFSAVCAFASAAATRFASGEAQTAETLNGNFQEARYAVVAQESLEHKYRLEPAPDDRPAEEAAARALSQAMAGIVALGDAGDRAAAHAIMSADGAYLRSTAPLFAAVDRGDLAEAAEIDRASVSPLLSRLRRAVDERAQSNRIRSQNALDRLTAIQTYVIEITFTLSVLGLVSLGLFHLILRKYQERLAATHRAEFRQLEAAALVDHLTGIGNHRAYKDRFAREASRANRHGESLSLALLDVDDFKVVNDRDGHLHGDSVLVTLASLLAGLRAEDGAYRVGGDEFALILPHTSLGEAKESMERLRRTLQDSLSGTTVSIGLATLGGVECEAETLQAQADAALYATKRSGRNGVMAFDGTLDEMWFLSPAKITNLRSLITDRGVDIVFQPIWDVDARQVLAYEALARPRAKYGFKGPQAAFDLAERVGRAHELDVVCRNAALARARELPADTLLFINVSPQALDHGRLDAVMFADAVRAAQIEPSRVVIEITERSITQVESVIGAARALQQHGFRLALDDTGAGNSGLEMLSRLTVDFVKIDREVVVKAQGDKNARAVLAGIVAIAQATGAYVIAEGVETSEMLDFVCRVGLQKDISQHSIQGVQGFLLTGPSENFVGMRANDDISALLTAFASPSELLVTPQATALLRAGRAGNTD